tara:strand:+ start:6424 stop:6975 length:552 start_codon:yes stop_codon:yes gene_type:complete
LQHIPDVSVYGMKLRHIIVILSVTGLGACSWPSLPSIPLTKDETGERPAISCDAATRLNLWALDWANAKRLDIHIRQARFMPGTLITKVNSPAVLRLFNGDRDVRTFRAKEFFRASAVVRIDYDGRRMDETCIDAIKVGPLKGAEIQIVPLRQGDFPFRTQESLDLSLGLFSKPGKPGHIIVR